MGVTPVNLRFVFSIDYEGQVDAFGLFRVTERISHFPPWSHGHCVSVPAKSHDIRENGIVVEVLYARGFPAEHAGPELGKHRQITRINDTITVQIK